MLDELAVIDALDADPARFGDEELLSMMFDGRSAATQRLVADRLCARHPDTDRATRDRLRPIVAATTDFAFGANVAALAMRLAIEDGELDEAGTWLAALEEQHEACLEWGRHGHLRDDPLVRPGSRTYPRVPPRRDRARGEAFAPDARVDCAAFRAS